jgi:uncharacterized protein (UPF0332 family)
VTSPFLRRAETSVKSAKLLLGVGDTDGASSRAYYAMYDAVRACLGWAGIAPERGEFKTHHGITTAFGLHLVKPGLFPVAASKAFHRVQFIRQTADYAVLPVPHDDAAEAVREAESFVAAAAALIVSRDPPPAELSS